MAEAKSENKKEHGERHKTTPVWEWIIAAVGLVLVAGSISLTLYRALTEELTPPILSISVDSVSSAENGFLVRFSIRNTGNQTAAGLNIEGVLKNGEEIIETSVVALTYAPANSRREGGLFFTRDPSQFNLQIRPLGYEKP